MARLRLRGVVLVVSLISALVLSLLALTLPAGQAGAQASGAFVVTVNFGGVPIDRTAVFINDSFVASRWNNYDGTNFTSRGRYQVSVPPGTYDVHVGEYPSTGVTYPAQVIYHVVVSAGQTVTMPFEVNRPFGQISGVVRTPSGAPAAGVLVEAFGTSALADTAPFGWGSSYTDGNGRYTVPRLLPNRSYALFVGVLGYRQDYVPVTAGATTPDANLPAGPNYAGGGPVGGASGIEGRIYAEMSGSGALRWYRHTDPGGGTVSWAPAASTIGSGWGSADTVIAGGGGILYTIRNGTLQWFRHADPDNGAFSWQTGNFGAVVGSGWNVFSKVVANGDGTMYAVKPDGTLTWWRHLGVSNGAYAWAAGSGTVIGNGFDQCANLFAGGQGVLYCVRQNGDLQYFRHLTPASPSVSWAGGSIIGSGWNGYRSEWSGGNGVLYALDFNGNLRWFKHTGFGDGAYSWQAANFGAVVGTGWNAVEAAVTGGLA